MVKERVGDKRDVRHGVTRQDRLWVSEGTVVGSAHDDRYSPSRPGPVFSRNMSKTQRGMGEYVSICPTAYTVTLDFSSPSPLVPCPRSQKRPRPIRLSQPRLVRHRDLLEPTHMPFLPPRPCSSRASACHRRRSLTLFLSPAPSPQYALVPGDMPLSKGRRDGRARPGEPPPTIVRSPEYPRSDRTDLRSRCVTRRRTVTVHRTSGRLRAHPVPPAHFRVFHLPRRVQPPRGSRTASSTLSAAAHNIVCTPCHACTRPVSRHMLSRPQPLTREIK